MKLKLILAISCLTCSSLGFSLSPAAEPAVKAQNEFAWSLLSDSSSFTEQTSNDLVSPLSAWLVLSLASNGADGATLDEMRNALKQSQWSNQETNERARALQQDLANGRDSQEKLSIATSVWANSDVFTFAPGFLEAARTYAVQIGDEPLHSAPFSQPQTLFAINNWAARETGGMIPSLVNQLDSSQAALLLNAVYLEGQWLKPFEAAETRMKDFHKADGSISSVQMMHSENQVFDYAENEDYQLLSLALRAGLQSNKLPIEGRYRADLILPRSSRGNFASLGQEGYQTLISQIKETNLNVAIPRFEFATTRSLNDTLRAAGIVRAFIPGQAELSRMSRGAPSAALFLGDILQKTAIEFSENGLKASAATVASISLTSVSTGPTPSFNADHPFFLVVRDVTTGTIIFQGVVADPQHQ